MKKYAWVFTAIMATSLMAAASAQAWDGGHGRGRGHHGDDGWHSRSVTYISYDNGYRPHCPPRPVVYGNPYSGWGHPYYGSRPVYVVESYPRPPRNRFGFFVNY